MGLRHMIFYRLVKQTFTLPLLSVLRKRRLAFFVFATQANCSDNINMSSKVTSEFTKDIKNGLLLYYHQYSFYSQKVVMALHEKKLPFESSIVNIMRGEQYSPSFLKINPRGEVPVLQDTGKIIPDSGRIIEYLEDNFSNGDTPRLIPIDEGPDVRQRVIYFRTIIELLPVNVITMGSFFHSEFVDKPKVPFIAPLRRMMANAEKNSSKNLREQALKNLDAKIVLTEKAEFQDKKHQIVTNKEEYAKVIAQLEEVLVKVEDELTKHGGDKENWWLCSDKFTVADIALTILLERLNQLGFEKKLWTDGKRPKIEKYYERVQQRDSYKKTIPNTLFLVKTIFISQGPIFLGLSIVSAIAIAVGGVILAKKVIS